MKPSHAMMLGAALLLVPACTDSVDPAAPPGDSGLVREHDDGVVPHDFTVTTDPSPLPAGGAADVIVSWTDANLNPTSVFLTMQGARNLGSHPLAFDEQARRCTYRQRLALPEAFASNLIFIGVRDEDGNVMHVHESQVEGGFTPPDNTPPREVRVVLYPQRITPGQTVQILLQGTDDENNMAGGLSAAVVGHPEIGFDLAGQTYALNPDARVFQYRMDMVAPAEPGAYRLELEVEDLVGTRYTYAKDLVVEPSNTPPVFTEIWIEDRVAAGYGDTIPFRVRGWDPDGDPLRLLISVGNGSSTGPDAVREDDGTTTWTGAYVARTTASLGFISFRLFDGNVEVPSGQYEVRIDQSGRPLLDAYSITRNGTETFYPCLVNTHLTVPGGEVLTFRVFAHDPQGGALRYEWSVYEHGSTTSCGAADTLALTMPGHETVIHVGCTVRDPEGNLASVSPTVITVR